MNLIKEKLFMKEKSQNKNKSFTKLNPRYLLKNVVKQYCKNTVNADFTVAR